MFNRTAAVLVAALATMSAAGSASAVVEPSAASPVGDPPRVSWEECERALWCGRLTVPSDWSEPDSEPITIGLAKMPAREPSTSLGTLLVNPGGPGPAVRNMRIEAYREQFAELTQWFDVVVFDPRGIGESSGVSCPQPVPVPLELPLTWTAYRAYSQANAEFAKACAEQLGPLDGTLNAEQVAHDMEAIRQALGEEKLNYFGNSYGTVYGQAYASLFGENIGRMYLDSVLDHTQQDLYEWIEPMAVAAERNLKRLADWCGRDSSCALHEDDLMELWDQVLAKAEREPIPAPDAGQDVTVDASEILSWTAARIGNDESWPGIAEALARAGDGDASLLVAPDQPPDTSLARAAFCADFRLEQGFAELKLAEARLRQVAPRLGWAVQPWGMSGHCTGLPEAGTFAPEPIEADGIPPVLIVNGIHDPRTPVEHGQRVAEQLPGSRFLRVEGNHGLYQNGDPCVREHAHRYLTTGTLPPPGAQCPATG